MNYKIFFIAGLLLPISIFSQLLPSSNIECTTTDSYSLPNQINSPDFPNNHCVDITFFVIESGSSNSPNYRRIDDILIEINLHFGIHGINFKWDGDTHDINNSSFFDLETRSEAIEMVNAHNKPDKMNFYIVNSIENSLGEALNIPSTNVIVTREATYYTTPSHELGHALGLYHTDATSFCKDDGIVNCKECGDRICDTSPDNGSLTSDAVMTNLMSTFYDKSKRDHFTMDQGDVMNYILSEHDLLSNTNRKIDESKISLSNLNDQNILYEGNWTSVKIDYEGRDPSDFAWEWSFQGISGSVKYSRDKTVATIFVDASVGQTGSNRTVNIYVRGTDSCFKTSDFVLQSFQTNGCGGSPGGCNTNN